MTVKEIKELAVTPKSKAPAPVLSALNMRQIKQVNSVDRL